MLATLAYQWLYKAHTKRSDAFVQSPIVRLRVVRQGVADVSGCGQAGGGLAAAVPAGGARSVPGQKPTLCPPTPHGSGRVPPKNFPTFFLGGVL